MTHTASFRVPFGVLGIRSRTHLVAEPSRRQSTRELPHLPYGNGTPRRADVAEGAGRCQVHSPGRGPSRARK